MKPWSSAKRLEGALEGQAIPEKAEIAVLSETKCGPGCRLKKTRLKKNFIGIVILALMAVFAAILVSPSRAADPDELPLSTTTATNAPATNTPAITARPKKPALPPPDLTPLLHALDANHDGIIDADEIAHASAALNAIDKNGDGRLTRDEYKAARKIPGSTPRPTTNALDLPPLPLGGLINFGVVDEHLMRGAEPGMIGIQALKSLGVTMIVDLTVPSRTSLAEQKEAERIGLAYTNFPMVTTKRPSSNQVSAVLAAVTNAPGRVFVHCQAGRDRTGTIVACYRMAAYHWSSEQALHEADDFRMASDLILLRDFIKDFAKPQDEVKASDKPASDKPETPTSTLEEIEKKRLQEEN